MIFGSTMGRESIHVMKGLETASTSKDFVYTECGILFSKPLFMNDSYDLSLYSIFTSGFLPATSKRIQWLN